jgi:hypothetical protein
VTRHLTKHSAGNTKGGSITVPLTSCLNGLDQSISQLKTKIVSYHTADSKAPRTFPEQNNPERNLPESGLAQQSRIFRDFPFPLT